MRFLASTHGAGRDAESERQMTAHQATKTLSSLSINGYGPLQHEREESNCWPKHRALVCQSTRLSDAADADASSAAASTAASATSSTDSAYSPFFSPFSCCLLLPLYFLLLQ